MKKLIEKYRKKIIIVASILLAVASLINFYFIFEITPFSNDECLWVTKRVSEDSTAIFFDLVKVGGVTWNAGIRDGDEFIAINGKKLTSVIVATTNFDVLKAGDFATYSVKRGDEIFDTQVEVKKLINFTGLGVSLLATIWFIVGFIVVMAKPNGKLQNLFYKIGATAVMFSYSAMFWRGDSPNNPIFNSATMVIIVDLFWTLGSIFYAFYMINFFLLFPKPFKILEKKWMQKFLSYSPFIISALAILFRIIFIYAEQSFRLYYYFFTANTYLVVLGFIIGLIALFIGYSRLKSKHERNSIFVILVAYMVGAVIIVYSATLANVITDTVFNSPQYFMPIIFIAIIPIAFGYSIFKYSLMDISELVKKSIMYLTATISLAVTYFVIIYLIGQSISEAIGTEYQGIIAGSVFVVFALVFQSTKDKFQEVITRKFYPDQFSFQKILISFSNDVSRIVGLENILDSATETFVKLLSLEKFGISLLSKDNNQFVCKRVVGFSFYSENFYADVDKVLELIDHKVSVKQAVSFEQSEFKTIFPNFYEELIQEEIYSVVPLTIKSKIIGFLFFGVKYSGAQFSGKDLDLLVASANQTAVSIENARLYEAEAQKQKIDRDLENAKIIQKGLLPKHVPEIKGLQIAGTMIPAMQVGGDYYDLIKISDTKLFIVIGDVSGKGLSASFYMSKLQTMMQLYCIDGKSPKEILVEANKHIYDKIERNWFITVSLALFDTEKNKMTFCRAGHTPLIQVKEGKVFYNQPSGIGVGLEKGDVFESSLDEIEVDLNPGDQVVLFSDGVNEAMNSNDEMFGLENFEKVLIEMNDKSVQTIKDEVIKSISIFRGDTLQNDDITLIVVKTDM